MGKHLCISAFFIMGFLHLGVAQKTYSVAIHGGAGNFNSQEFTPELREAYTQFFDSLLVMADSMAVKGDSAIKIVEAVIVRMEDNPMFNAGRGAVLNENGCPELDASVMDGSSLNAGAIAGVSHINNPVRAAVAVMKKSPHVFFSGKGAEDFAAQAGIELVDSSYFITSDMNDRFRKIKEGKNGTVGCVVLDTHGNIAAGTSTGGMMMKKKGRIGDSPVIGAGTYADSRFAGISCTGHGEFFIRYVVAYDIIARMKYRNQSLEEAVHELLFDVLLPAGGTGGLVAVSSTGQVVADFNTRSMFRAWTTQTGEHVIRF